MNGDSDVGGGESELSIIVNHKTILLALRFLLNPGSTPITL